MSNKIIVEAECSTCRATGLYVGMGERDGAAVVCNKCKGTGMVILTFDPTPFTGRKQQTEVQQVWQGNPGICTAPGHVSGGLTYDDWAAGKPFISGTEMREEVCPAWWYQSADYDRMPQWDRCQSSYCGGFSSCIHFIIKAECWEMWDDESGGRIIENEQN